ncbi:MAG: lysostaphin resistance A-like protein [Calditrichaceae bacterium]
MKKYFYNSDEGRLRAGWRILIFIMMFWLFSAMILAIKPLLGEISKKEFLENYSIVILSILAIGASIAVPLARRLLDKRSFVSLGLKIDKSATQDIVFGFFLSGLMAGLVFSLMIILGLIEYNGIKVGNSHELNDQSSYFVRFMSVISIGSLSILLLETILVGYWEELVFRGYLFQNMIAGMGMKLAIAISCLIYGLIHSTNPNAGLLSSSIIVLFGLLRIYGYLATKMLWLSIGMHIGWNFFQGPIFGYAASGHKKATLIDQTATSPDWLSGGAFGPEGSVIVIPIIILALLIIRWWSRRHHIKFE